MIKLTLEQRIARLEKLLVASKSVKNESFDIDEDEVRDLANELMNDEIAADYRWGNDKEGNLAFMREFDRLANGANPKLVSELINLIADELGVSPRELRAFRDMIADTAAEAADGILDVYCDPAGFPEMCTELGIMPNEVPDRCRRTLECNNHRRTFRR